MLGIFYVSNWIDELLQSRDVIFYEFASDLLPSCKHQWSVKLTNVFDTLLSLLEPNGIVMDHVPIDL